MSASEYRSIFPGGDSPPLPRHHILFLSPSTTEDPGFFTVALRERAKALVLKSKNPRACLDRFREKIQSHLDLLTELIHPLEERVILENNKKDALLKSEAASSYSIDGTSLSDDYGIASECLLGPAPILMEQQSTVEEEAVVTGLVGVTKRVNIESPAHLMLHMYGLVVGAATHEFIKEPNFIEFIDSYSQLFSTNLQIGVDVQQGSVQLPLKFCNEPPDPGKGKIKEYISPLINRTARVCARSMVSVGIESNLGGADEALQGGVSDDNQVKGKGAIMEMARVDANMEDVVVLEAPGPGAANQLTGPNVVPRQEQ